MYTKVKLKLNLVKTQGKNAPSQINLPHRGCKCNPYQNISVPCKLSRKKKNGDYKIILGIIINHYLRIWSFFLPNPDFKQFLLSFYNSLTFLKAAYSKSKGHLIFEMSFWYLQFSQKNERILRKLLAVF